MKDVLENIARERQEEKTAMDETIQKLQEEKQTQAQKMFDLEQKVNILGVLTLPNTHKKLAGYKIELLVNVCFLLISGLLTLFNIYLPN